MMTIALYITIAMVTLAALLNMYRLIKGPDAPDRVLEDQKGSAKMGAVQAIRDVPHDARTNQVG